MNEVKRYTLVGDMDGNCNLNEARMEVCASGEYVRTRDYAKLQEQLTATTNSLTNAQEALKSAGIEADTVQAGVMELVNKLAEETNRANQNAEYLEALTERMLAAEARCNALAAENAALKTFINQSCYSYDGDGSDVCDSYVGADESPFFPKTPATDSYLNVVRAEGVEMFASHFNCPDISDDILEFAAQLRSGNAGKDGV